MGLKPLGRLAFLLAVVLTAYLTPLPAQAQGGGIQVLDETYSYTFAQQAIFEIEIEGSLVEANLIYTVERANPARLRSFLLLENRRLAGAGFANPRAVLQVPGPEVFLEKRNQRRCNCVLVRPGPIRGPVAIPNRKVAGRDRGSARDLPIPARKNRCLPKLERHETGGGGTVGREPGSKPGGSDERADRSSISARLMGANANPRAHPRANQPIHGGALQPPPLLAKRGAGDIYRRRGEKRHTKPAVYRASLVRPDQKRGYRSGLRASAKSGNVPDSGARRKRKHPQSSGNDRAGRYH